MKGFIQRLTLLIHWLGFLFSLGIPTNIISGLYFLITGSGSRGLENVTGIVICAGIAFLFWVLKWLISGNKSIFPWKS